MNLYEYYRNKLDIQQKGFYDRIKNAIRDGKDTVSLNGVGLSDARRAYSAYFFDHPERVYYPGIAFMLSSDQAQIQLDKLPEFDEATYNNNLMKLSTRIQSKIKDYNNKYEVTKAIFDVLCAEVTYQQEALDEYLQIENENRGIEAHIELVNKYGYAFTAYGIVVKKKGVCMGIAKLYKVLCDAFDIPCACVPARVGNGGSANHLLNVVEINEKLYFVDVSNSLKTKSFPMIRYNFFMVPYSIMSTFGSSFELGDSSVSLGDDFNCTDDDLIYCKLNNSMFSNKEDMRLYLQKIAFKGSNREVRCYYTGDKMSNDELKTFFEEIVVFNAETRYQLIDNVTNGFCNGLLVEGE